MTKDIYQESCKLALSKAYEVNEICQPLFSRLNAHGFSLHRIYKDGQRVYLGNSYKWIENVYENGYLAASGYQKYSDYPNCILWNEWPQTDTEFIRLINDARENFSYDNSAMLLRKYESYVDIFFIRGRLNDNDINHKFFSDRIFIEGFFDDFLIRTAKLITQAYKHKLIIPEKLSRSESCKTLENQETFHDCLYAKVQDTIFFDTNGLGFSRRESQCLLLMFIGKTAKEIANILGISGRSVEKYIDSVKHKANTSYKNEILEKLMENELNRRILANFLTSL